MNAQMICHLGLGDLIITSAIAEWLTIDQYDKVYYPCRKRDEASVRSFFLLSPRVEVYPIETESTTPDSSVFRLESTNTVPVNLGFYSPNHMDSSVSFAESFYRQLDIPYSVRFDYCPIQAVCDKYYDALVHMKKFSLVHHDPARFYCINEDYIENAMFIGSGNSSVLAYYPFIKYAKHILAIDSFLIHLVDSLKTSAYLEYHKYSRPLSHRWNDFDVPSKFNKWHVLP